MTTRPSVRSGSIAALTSLPALLALGACGGSPDSQPTELTQFALSAVTENAGAPTNELAREVDDLFIKDGLGETRAVLVMKDGKIAAERYGDGYNEETRFISWSMAKTV
ncbi:MAG: serine hydrolase, partial [Pseudomonadota bacterium]